MQIVANKRNNIDVDRWDYLNRDSKCSGVAVDFDHGRLLAQARVVLDEKGIRTIAYRVSEFFLNDEFYCTEGGGGYSAISYCQLLPYIPR